MSAPPDLSGRSLFTAGFTAEIALVFVAAVLGVLFLDRPFPFPMRFTVVSFAVALTATLPAGIAAVVLTSPAGRRFGAFEGIYRRVKDVLDRPLRELTVLELVVLAGAAGIGEEVLFRGVVQQLAGLWLTSLIFGLLHALTAAYFVLATIMGLYLGWLLRATDNLIVPVIVHWLYDAIALWLLKREFEKDALESSTAAQAEEGAADVAPEADPETPPGSEDPEAADPGQGGSGTG